MAGPESRPRWAADPALPRRVATAVVGASLVLAGVLLLPTAGVAAAAALVALAAAWEWARLAGVRGGARSGWRMSP
ncbi:MAG: hypothetical protein U5K43_12515 [Halofilum sp. (in: g-proteobacteria)]|nr:hypothetical protein [Halofilum sp. (in: g-proteobacteria)]